MTKYLGKRALTLVDYVLVIIGINHWSDNPDSWGHTLWRLAATTAFLWFAVYRTIEHYHEDREKDERP